jgi:hypothetical protein
VVEKGVNPGLTEVLDKSFGGGVGVKLAIGGYRFLNPADSAADPPGGHDMNVAVNQKTGRGKGCGNFHLIAAFIDNCSFFLLLPGAFNLIL